MGGGQTRRKGGVDSGKHAESGIEGGTMVLEHANVVSMGGSLREGGRPRQGRVRICRRGWCNSAATQTCIICKNHSVFDVTQRNSAATQLQLRVQLTGLCNSAELR